MRTANQLISHPLRTFEGAPAVALPPLEELRRAVATCLLWEDQFYESGKNLAERVRLLVEQLPIDDVAALAREARSRLHLRHAPLWLVVCLFEAIKARSTIPGGAGKPMGDLIADVIQRPDEAAELVALWWRNGKRALPKQMKRGLALSFGKFDAYQLAKNDRPGKVRLRDAMFLSHPKPIESKVELYKQLADDTLPTPDTWETELSAGKDKRETFERLIAEKRLGALALLRNLRNMIQASVPDVVVRAALDSARVERVLPFRFITAARAAPRFEPELERLMLKVPHEKLPGKTVLLVDVSGSMVGTPVSKRSELDRRDAAIALAMLCREACDDVTVLAFTEKAVEIPPRRGFALRDAILKVLPGGTNIGLAVTVANGVYAPDRIICITDEQSHDRVGGPRKLGYMVNVASYAQSVAYGPWVSVSGWSESVLDFIRECERPKNPS